MSFYENLIAAEKEIAQAQAALDASCKKRHEVICTIDKRIYHIIRLCAPITGFPGPNVPSSPWWDNTKSTFTKKVCKISIQFRYEMIGWEHKRYIMFPTRWLDHNVSDEEIIGELTTWLAARTARRQERWKRASEADQKKKQKELLENLQKMMEKDPSFAQSIGKKLCN